MDVRHLRYFLAVVDHGSFTRAAAVLLVAQPSISQAIKGLERELGVVLFHRVGRSIKLSESGRELEGPARVVLRDLEAVGERISALRGIQCGRVDIVTMPSPGIEPLTTLIAEFHREHPQIVLDVAGSFTAEETIEQVRKGRAEIGLLGTHRPGPHSDLLTIPLGRQPLMLVVNPHADGFGPVEVVSRPSLVNARIVASQPGSAMRTFADELIVETEGMSITAEITHRTSILPLVEAGLGHAILPSSWMRTAAHHGLRMLPIEDAPSLHMAAVARPQMLTPAASRFIDLVSRHGDGTTGMAAGSTRGHEHLPGADP